MALQIASEGFRHLSNTSSLEQLDEVEEELRSCDFNRMPAAVVPAGLEKALMGSCITIALN